MIEQRKPSIAIFVKSKEKELLLKHMLKDEGTMLQGDVKLHGASNLSKHSYCKDCKKSILDMSRTRKRARCEICTVNHMSIIRKISSERMAKERKDKRDLLKKKRS